MAAKKRVSKGAIPTRREPRGLRYRDESKLRVAVVRECEAWWRANVGNEWTEADRAQTRHFVESICADALDARAARALWQAASAAIERLSAPHAHENTPARVFMRRNVAQMFLHLPPMPDGADRLVDERAALVELCDGRVQSNFASLGRRARASEIARVYFLCGYWPPLGGEMLTVGEVVQRETKRVAAAMKLHGQPDARRRAAEYAVFVLRATDPERPGGGE